MLFTFLGIGITITFLSICCCLCRGAFELIEDDDEEENSIETRFQNQPMQTGPPYPVPYTIDMNNGENSGDLPPSYQQATIQCQPIQNQGVSWKDAI